MHEQRRPPRYGFKHISDGAPPLGSKPQLHVRPLAVASFGVVQRRLKVLSLHGATLFGQLTMHEERKQNLRHFVAWSQQHIKGDEKGESQIFLDRLFIAFELGGVKEAGATLEYRVKKESRGGTAFADLVWKPIVLIR